MKMAYCVLVSVLLTGTVRAQDDLTTLWRWTSHVGSQLDAYFSHYENGVVTLVTPEGARYVLWETQLAGPDRNFVHHLYRLKRERLARRTAPPNFSRDIDYSQINGAAYDDLAGRNRYREDMETLNNQMQLQNHYLHQMWMNQRLNQLGE